MSVLKILFLAPLLTCLVEVPVQRLFKTTGNTLFLIAINVMTNYILNVPALFLVSKFGPDSVIYYIWTAVGELLWIPISEAFLLTKISDCKKGKIFLVTYLANALSLVTGLVVMNIIF